MKNSKTIAIFGLALAALTARAQDKWDITKVDVSKLPAVADKKDVTYAKDIKPLFEASCFRCHGAQRPKGSLRLDSLEAVLKGGEDGKMVVVGDSKKSLLVAAAAQIDDEIAMPPKRGPGGGRGFDGPGAPGGAGGPPPDGAPGKQGDRPAGAPQGTNSFGPRGGGFGGPGGPGGPAKPLTAEQVGLIRAWIDQGAK